MGKKVFIVSALAAGSLAAVSNAMLNIALRRTKTAPQEASSDPQARAVDAWFDRRAVRVTHRNRSNMRLTAWFVPNPGSRRYAVICHGHRNCGRNMRHRGKPFFDMGFNVLMPDARAHGGSDGKMIGMGWPERRDIVEWIYEILKRDPEAQILLYGESMGAATVMMTAGEVLPEQVKLAIEDCGYTSVWDQMKSAIPHLYNIPPYPILPVASGLCRLRAGYTFREASAIKQVRRCKIPMLFIHGEKDDFVPYPMVHRLYEAAACEKQLLTVPEAGHCLSAETDPELYWGTIRSFVERYIGR
ncbi:MAG: alpha/beta hydrolase [Hominenteromicrobium sp.]